MGSYVEKILEHFLQIEQNRDKYKYNELSWDEKDKFRLLFDNDAKYYSAECHLEDDEALKADTIISFWIPYCSLLRQEANWNIYNNAKTTRTLEALLCQIQKENEEIIKVNEKINEFAKYYYTKGNYMLLPKRGMNTERYKITEDRIDCTLYECFANGSLSSFFADEQALFSWIKRERLESVFINNITSKNNISWFTKLKNKISEMQSTEIYEYLNNAINLIKIRNQ